jgi:hypothetical protein
VTSPRITREELLAPISRWPWQTKFWVCEGIRHGIITASEAKAAHGITDEEFSRWYGLYERHGATGLKKINRNHRRRAA